MYVEFVGIPGAGKTTLVAEVRKLLEQKGVECVTRATFFSQHRKWLYKLFWSLLHPQYLDLSAAKLLIRLSRKRGSTFEKLITRLHEHQKLQYQLAHHKDVVVLWDAGHVQRLANLLKEDILSANEVQELIYARLPTESLLVMVETPVDEALRRMVGREPSHKVEGLKETQTRTQQAQENVFEMLAQRGVAMIRLDGMKPLTENAAIVCERIKEQL